MNTSSPQPRAAKAIATKCALTVSVLAAAVAGVFASLPAAAVGRMNDPMTGFIWDNLAHNHLTFRVYGEFVTAEWCNERRKAASPEGRDAIGAAIQMHAD